MFVGTIKEIGSGLDRAWIGLGSGLDRAFYIRDKTMVSYLKVNLETNFVFDLITFNCRL